MKKCNTKFISLLLTLLMLLSFLPATVYAADSEVAVSTVSAMQNAFNNGGTVGLYSELYPTSELVIPEGKTVTLNMHGWRIFGAGTGYVLNVKGNLTITTPAGWTGKIGRSGSVTGLANSIIHVAPGATLTLKPDGPLYIQGANQANTGGGIVVENGTLNMYANTTIQNCTAVSGSATYTGVGGGVHLKDSGTNGSTFNMYGGTISNCAANGDTSSRGMGGGVYVATNSTFNMSGGTISECTAGRYGGGVLTYGKTNISGGTIENCSATLYSGGGLHVSKNTSTMSGGTIKNCTAAAYGGGVSLDNGILNITGGTITSCKATNTGGVTGDGGSGGGAYVTNATINMSGGKIEKCSTVGGNNGGGGVMIGDKGTFTMSGTALITDCTSQYGGGVDPFQGTVNLNGGIIQNCTSSRHGGGVYACSTAALTLNGTTITGNTATNNGGGIYAEKNSTITITSGTIGNNSAADGSGVYSGGTVNYGANANYSIENSYVPKIQSTVTLHDATGSNAITATFTEALPKVTVPTRENYTFAGYFDEQTGGTQYYNADGVGTKIWDSWTAKNLYAQWTGNTYPVTLDNGEGSGETSVTATYGSAMPKVTPPTWDKHVFQGYFTQQGKAYYDANGESVKVWDQDSDSVTLYAHWADSAKIEDLSLELDGDIGMRFHSTVNEEALKTGYMTMSVGGKAAKTQTVRYNETEKDSTGKAIFSFDVSAIELAEKITANFYDENGTLYDTASESVEDYYGLLKEDTKVAADAKAVVKALVNYGHFAQQALSKTRGWVIGSDYAATAKQNDLTATAEDLKAYSPIIIGNDDHVKGIGMSLLLDNKTTLCLYFTTSDGEMPHVRVDGGGELIPTEYDETANVASQYIERMSDGRWLVRIPNIDAVNLGTIHKVTADGRTIYLSALSYGSVITGEENVNAICALYEYYQAALQYAKLQEITSATAQDASYTGSAIEPQLTVMSGNTALTESQYEVEWLGDLIEVGTHIGIVRAKSGNFVGGALVQFTVNG